MSALREYMVSLRDSHGSLHVGLFQAPGDNIGALLSAVSERFDLKHIPSDLHVEGMGKAKRPAKAQSETEDYRSALIPMPTSDDLEPIEIVGPEEFPL